ncbi:glycosyl hydrolase family 32 [Coraliomargarita sp. W4R53]
MNRRDFIEKTALGGIAAVLAPKVTFSKDLDLSSSQFLYNGIKLPDVWPPRDMSLSSYQPMPVPYLETPPAVVPIDVGRQLFVDDFLIDQTTLKRTFHNAKKLENNPVLKPETDFEKGLIYETQTSNPVAAPKDGGVWWDPKDELFKMWYECGWLLTSGYATSKDGITWERPDLGIIPGTNRILPYLVPDSSTVFLDHFTSNPQERYKMFTRGPGNTLPSGFSMTSPDGIHWSTPIETGPCGDRSTMFYNPFRRKWVYSIRSFASSALPRVPSGRARFYREHDDFIEGAKWDADSAVFWTGADNLDLPDPEIGDNAQLYNLAAVGYESVMLGLHQIHLGPGNNECAKMGIPKITDLKVSFSRDGFHWDRPHREAFIPSTRQEGSWDRGYVQSVGGVCSVVGDELWFYYSGFEGDTEKTKGGHRSNGMYYNGSTGIATLRRDGFASMSSVGEFGTLTTRLVTFKGKNLFVNVDCPQGEFRAEVLNRDGSVIAPFSVSNCIGVSKDSTLAEVRWNGGQDLSSLIGKEVRFKFYVKKGGFYSFWVSPEKTGASHGYNAAGGPGFKGGVDLEGINAYQVARPFQLT